MKFLMFSLTALAAAVSAAAIRSSSSATCVASAATSTSTSSFSMADYTAVAAPVTGTAYDIDPTFRAAHAFSSTMVRLSSAAAASL